MLKASKLLLLPIAVAILIAGCAQNHDETGMVTGPNLSAAYVPAAGDAVTSATLYVYVNQISGKEVTAHRITSDWTEGGVTWDNFAGAFDGTTAGSFMSDAYGWKTVDITSLVTGWSDGDFSNYGVLLKQGYQETPRTWMNSRENAANHPYLEVCYSTAGGPVCQQYPALADASIAQNYPTDNFGFVVDLWAGWPSTTDAEKQALLRFDIPALPNPASIGDFVWYDANDNGIQDIGEVGVPGVTVELLDCAGNVLATTLTDANGYYLFANLTPGDYRIHFVLPEGDEFSPMDQGSDDAVDSDADVTTGLTACTTLDAGENDMTWDAGIFSPPPPGGCTYTIGYWKNHGGFGPQPDYVTQFLPIWLGTPGGLKSMDVNSGVIAHDILGQKTYGDPSNGITKLYAQMLGAKLNIAAGASGGAIAATITAADAFLATHNYLDWNSLSKSEKKAVLNWQGKFGNYNEGLIGPGHCD